MNNLYFSQAELERRSKQMKAMWQDPEYREHFNQVKGKQQISDQGIQNIRNANIGKVNSEETRRKISEANKARWEKNRDKLLAVYASPEYREAFIQGLRDSHRTPEYRAKMSKIVKERKGCYTK